MAATTTPKTLLDFLEGATFAFDDTVTAVGNSVGALCTVAIVLYIGSKIWSSIVSNEPINPYPLLRPFVIGLLCLNFVPLVINPINFVITPTTKYINTRIAKVQTVRKIEMDELFEKQEERVKQAKEEVAKTRKNLRDVYANIMNTREKNNTLKNVLKTTTIMQDYESQPHKIGISGEIGSYLAYDELNDEEKQMIRDAKVAQDETSTAAKQTENSEISKWTMIFIRCVQWLCECLYNVAFYGMAIIRAAYLNILTMLGPLAFAFSILPGFTGGLVNWMAKYLSVSIWLPIMYVIGHFNDSICSVVIASAINGNVQGGIGLTAILFNIIGVYMILSVPTIASWVIQGGDTGNAKTGFSMLGGLAGSIAGAAIGRSMTKGAKARSNAQTSAMQSIAKGLSSLGGGSGSSEPPK